MFINFIGFILIEKKTPTDQAILSLTVIKETILEDVGGGGKQQAQHPRSLSIDLIHVSLLLDKR